MKLYTAVIDWLNDEPLNGPFMQLEGSYAMVSWRDLQMNAFADRATNMRNAGLVMMLVVGIPLLMLV